MSLGGAVGAVMLAWIWMQPSPMPTSAIAIALLSVVTALWLVRLMCQTPPLTLHWDSQRWQLARDGGGERVGELAVALDLGGWMLLRFTPDATYRSPATVWIPLQRPGLEPQWHALRATLYSARPHKPPNAGDA